MPLGRYGRFGGFSAENGALPYGGEGLQNDVLTRSLRQAISSERWT
jgi:hypothetical protein